MIEKPRLEWLVLPTEATEKYTNFGDGDFGDTSNFVARVNADKMINRGNSNWRLPTIDELKLLIGAPEAPKRGRFWTASMSVGYRHYAWSVCFSYSRILSIARSCHLAVRLVRTIQ